jgi:hypothetical protein
MMTAHQQPDIERLLTTPEDAQRVPLADVPGLLARLASAQLQLAGLQATLLARLLAGPIGRGTVEDRLLNM